MGIKTALCGLFVLPLFAGVATAAGPLSDRQMDRVTGGDLALIVCPDSCGDVTAVSSGSTSMNGVTTTTTGTGGAFGNGGNSGNGSNIPGLPGTVTMTQLQAFLAALVNGGLGPAVSTH